MAKVTSKTNKHITRRNKKQKMPRSERRVKSYMEEIRKGNKEVKNHSRNRQAEKYTLQKNSNRTVHGRREITRNNTERDLRQRHKKKTKRKLTLVACRLCSQPCWSWTDL